MCGIVTGQQSHPFDKNKVSLALNSIAHRGPDEQSVFYFKQNQAFIGHTRLSIVDVQGGNQPLTNADNSIIAVVNGEFYDYQRIRDSFSSYSFKTHSDSEILLPLYEKYGVGCLNYLHGEFAFVLFDTRLNRWFAARDRMGVRPLHYVNDSEKKQVFFASEAKSLLELGVERKLNRQSLWFSQHFQYTPQNETLFENVHMIPPASYILIKDNQQEITNYWNFPTQITTDSFETASEKISFLLDNAVQKRIPDEVAWCTHLSGGIDSSIVSYLSAQQKSEQPTHNFTVSFTDDGFYDELPMARDVSNRIGSQLHVVPVSFIESLQAMPQAIYHAEGLSINGHLGAKYLLNQAIHQSGFKVALSGEGSDEIFMGYSHLKQDFLSEDKLKLMEKTYLNGVQLPSGETLDLSLFEQEVGFIPTWIKAKSSMAHKLSHLWHQQFTFDNPLPHFLQESQARKFFNDYGKNKSASLLWSRYCLSGYILKVLDDAQAMAHSVEGRLPFLDTELMEYVWSLPDDYYFQGDIEKTILRQLFKGKIPDSVVNKTKQSFMSPPIQRALKNPLGKDMIYGYLLDNPYFENQKIFNREKLEAALALWQEDNSASVEPLLMTILSIAIFCHQFKIQ
jgi:asparagine synthase (glutamine-hydrolysing)